MIAAALLVPAGFLADRIGRVTPMASGLALFAVCLLAVPLTSSPLIACVIACIAAAGYVLSLPAISASLIDVSHQGNRGLLTGLSTSIQAVGIVLGPLIGRGGERVRTAGSFRIAALIIAVAAALALLYGARMRSRRGNQRRGRSSRMRRMDPTWAESPACGCRSCRPAGGPDFKSSCVASINRPKAPLNSPAKLSSSGRMGKVR